MIKKTFFLFCIFILLIGIIPSAELIKEISTATLENVGSLISDELANEDISVASATITKEGDNNRISFFGENPSAKIKNDLFENIDTNELAYLELNDLGEIVTADLTASEDTVFSFGGTPYAVNKGERVYYKDGKVISYGNSIGIKEKDSDKFTTLNCLGDSLEFEKDAKGNSVVVGDLKIGNDEAMGKITLSNGKISEIWEGTDATINGINNKVSGNNLKVTYNKDFDLSKCESNCINYETDKISLKGFGFTTNLGRENDVFGDMENEKEIHLIGTKERDLEIIMNGGDLEISNSEDPNLGFDIKHGGDFIINNGRISVYSEKDLKLEEQQMFVKADYGEELTYSYDINFNNGEHVLESNIFKDDKGNELFNGNLPWENVILKANEISNSEARLIKKRLQEEGKLLYEGDPFFLDWLRGDCGEVIMKQIYLAQETANQNKDGIKGSPLNFYGLLKAEGAGFQGVDKYGYKSIPFFEMYCDNPKREIAGTVGLTLVGSEANIERLRQGNYIPKDHQVESISGLKYYMPHQPAENVFVYAAGVFNNQEYKLRESIKKLYGEEYLDKISKDKYDYLKTIAYWAPFTFERYLEDIDGIYVEKWGDKPIPSTDDTEKLADNLEYIKWLARLRTDFEYYLGPAGLNLFAYP